MNKCMCKGYTCGGQRTPCKGQFAPSTLWVLELKFTLSAPLPTEPSVQPCSIIFIFNYFLICST